MSGLLQLSRRVSQGACLVLLALVGLARGEVSVCFEKVSDVPAIYMQEHPIGNVLAVGTQDGLIKLLVRPEVQSGTEATNYSTFLDITGRVHYQGEQGLLSFAFHPDFKNNGRFFVSYICDAGKFPECQGPCACSTFNNCTTAPTSCPMNTIVGEYWAGPNPLQALTLNSTEVRQILRFGRPGDQHNGGHIWFGSDGFLYFASGDGIGSAASPIDTAQNGKVPLGKILRIAIDAPPGQSITKSTFGIYGVPNDNPFVNASHVMPEVYALGLRNPWRCSQDPVTQSIFCGDIGPGATQEADLILPGGNYGWPFYDGSTSLTTVLPNIRYYPPTLEYQAADSQRGQGIIGGHVYRAQRNPCIQGRYLFGDNNGMTYVGSPYNDNTTVENVFISIALDSANLTISKEGLVESLGFPADDNLFSWGIDSQHELYRLSTSGIYRVIDTTMCGGSCDGKIQLYFGKTGSRMASHMSWLLVALTGLASLILIRY